MRIISAIILLLFCTSLCFAADKDGVIQRTEYILDDVWNDTGDSLNVGLVSGDVSLSPASTFTTGQTTILVVGGAAEALTVDSVAIRSVTISALPNNAGAIYIGVSGDSVGNTAETGTSYGFALSRDMTHTITIPVDNLRDVWISGDTVGEGVSWLGIR